MRSLLILALLLPHLLSAQGWQWSHQIGGPGGEGTLIIGVDADASVYVYGGYTGPAGVYIGEDTLHGPFTSTFLAKYADDGTLEWLRNCTSPGGISIYGATLDSTANKLYIVGRYGNSCTLDTCTLSASGGTGGFLSQWDLEGHCLWARNVVISGTDLMGNSCTASAVAVDEQGRILLGGTTTPYGPSFLAGHLVPQGTFMAAYDASGDTLWTRMIASYQGDFASLYPISSRTWNGHVFVSNTIYLHTTSDTVTVDTVVITGFQGGAQALLRLDPTDGSVDWVRADGFPYVGPNLAYPRQLHVNASGNLFVNGGFGTGSVFGTDTLNISGSSTGGGFLAEYNADGDLLWVRTYEATGKVFFAEMSGRSDGTLDVTGWIMGSATWNGVSYSGERQNMLVASFTPAGDCIGIEGEVGPALGRSIAIGPDGLYLAGLFPPDSPPQPPFEPITIGTDTYNTFGGRDAFLAKHSLNVGVGVPSYRSLEADGLHIYANPNRGSFRLEMPDAFANERDLLLRIYDSTGRMVLEQPMDMGGAPVRLDIFDAVPGLYNVTLTNGRKTCSGSMVVE